MFKSAYTIISDTLESYIHFRKLNRCKALSNFIDHRNKVYKHEKITQQSSPKTRLPMKEISAIQTPNTQAKMIKLEETQSSPSMLFEVRRKVSKKSILFYFEQS